MGMGCGGYSFGDASEKPVAIRELAPSPRYPRAAFGAQRPEFALQRLGGVVLTVGATRAMPKRNRGQMGRRRWERKWDAARVGVHPQPDRVAYVGCAIDREPPNLRQQRGSGSSSTNLARSSGKERALLLFTWRVIGALGRARQPGGKAKRNSLLAVRGGGRRPG